MKLYKTQRIAVSVVYGCVLAILIAAIAAHKIVQTGAFAFNDVGFHLDMGILGATVYFQMLLRQAEQA